MVDVERRSMSPTPAAEAASTGRATARRDELSLTEVVDTMLDRGVVIDANARATLVFIDFEIDAQAVVASVDTYLRFARAVSRPAGEGPRLPPRSSA
jgi:gas vesicle structural protein